jgi:apolipoprotein N-acyltransferase
MGDEALEQGPGPEPDSPAMGLVPALGVAIAAGVLVGLAFPPNGWSLLAWVAIAPICVVLRRVPLGAALGLSALFVGVAAWVIGDWFPRAVADYFLQPLPVAGALWVAVVATMAGPYYMAFAAAYRILARRFVATLPLLAGAAWVAVELGRGRLLTESPFFIGNPWGLIGYSQVPWLPLVQVAAFAGIYGVTFLVVPVNVGLAELWLARRASRSELRRRFVGLGLALLPGLFAGLYGMHVMGEEPAAEGAAQSIAIVQAKLDVGTRWRADLYGRNLDVYLRLTDEVARAARPATVFWPEASMTFFLEEEPLYRASIARVQRAHDIELVAGGTRSEDASEGPRYFNAVYAIEPSGEIRGHYDKQYLVPFAEYFPLRVDLLRRSFGRVRYFERGADLPPLATRPGAAGVVVCNEVMLPEVVARRVASGARYLLNPSNDSWIPDRGYTEQQLSIARMRAVEQGRDLVRVSTGGPSAIVDPRGRVVAQTAVGERTTLVGEVRPRGGRTVYGRVGDAFALACLVVSGIAVSVARRPRGDDVRSP